MKDRYSLRSSSRLKESYLPCITGKCSNGPGLDPRTEKKKKITLKDLIGLIGKIWPILIM